MLLVACAKLTVQVPGPKNGRAYAFLKAVLCWCSSMIMPVHCKLEATMLES